MKKVVRFRKDSNKDMKEGFGCYAKTLFFCFKCLLCCLSS